jgi:hypothetical protein
MDILAHALWAGVGITLVRRRRPVAPHTVPLTIGLAALPDVLHLLPIIGWWLFGDRTFAVVRAYAIAVPGQEPALPPWVKFWSHHLHCVMHSAIVAGVITLLLRTSIRSLWLPLLGWWSHIVIDFFTHSADYYPAVVLYPLSDRTFSGLAWNTPWFLVLNYLALGVTGLWLFSTGKSRRLR